MGEDYSYFADLLCCEFLPFHRDMVAHELALRRRRQAREPDYWDVRVWDEDSGRRISDCAARLRSLLSPDFSIETVDTEDLVARGLLQGEDIAYRAFIKLDQFFLDPYHFFCGSGGFCLRAAGANRHRRGPAQPVQF